MCTEPQKALSISDRERIIEWFGLSTFYDSAGPGGYIKEYIKEKKSSLQRIAVICSREAVL